MKSTQSSERYRFLIPYLLVLFAVFSSASVGAVLKYDQLGTGIDDANIYFVYARNLVEGFGLVYNQGGERVEGYTSPLWMLVCAAGFWITESPQRLILILNFVLVYLSLAFTVHTLARYISSKHLWLLCLLLSLWISGNPDYVSWSVVSLLETGMWSALLVVLTMMIVMDRHDSTNKVHRRGLFFIGFLVILTLSRPESLVWGPFLVVMRALVLIRNSRYYFRVTRDLGIPLLSFGLTALALVWFRIWYFGFPLPNTYYAKVSDDRFYNFVEGGKYLFQFLMGSPSSTFVFLVVLSISFVRRHVIISALLKPSEQIDLLLVLGVVVAFHLLVPLATGGDHFAQFRQYQPLLPLLPVLLTLALEIGWPPERPFFSRWMLGLLASLGTLLIIGNRARWYDKDLTRHIDGEFVLARRDLSRSQLLNDFFRHLSQLPRIGQIAAGAIQLGYRGHVVDLMGLNNVAMAHAPGEKKGLKNHAAFNKDIFFEQMPELFFVSFSESQYVEDPGSWGSVAMKGIFFQPQFQNVYSPVIIRSPDDVPLFAYIRNDYKSVLSASGFRFEDGTLPFGQPLPEAVTPLG